MYMVAVHVYVHISSISYIVCVCVCDLAGVCQRSYREMVMQLQCYSLRPLLMTRLLEICSSRDSLSKSDQTDFGQKGYHMKGHLKRNRMTQISAS